MPYRPRDIYRGRRKFRTPLTIILFVIALLLVGAVVLFYALQQFVVYGQDSVELVLPWEDSPATEATPEPEQQREPVSFEIVYQAPDFSALSYGSNEGLGDTIALFIPADHVTDNAALTADITEAQAMGCTGVILQMKSETGVLVWPSASAMAAAYLTGGTTDVTSMVSTVHSLGMTAAAQISVCIDELLAERNWPLCLQSAGAVYRDADGRAWLDPYNTDLRDYILDLCAELAAMGFDEIILDDLCQPVVPEGTVLTYSVTTQSEPNPVSGICKLGQRIVESLEDSGVTVSAVLDADSLINGLGQSTGQDVETFWRLFDRLYCAAADAQTAFDCAAAALPYGSINARFVPVSAAAPDGFAGYVIDYAAVFPEG